MTAGRRWLAFLPLLGTIAAITYNLTVPFEESSAEVAAGLIAFLSALSFASIGSYLAFRLPRNAVGWLMAAYGFLFTLVLLTESIAGTTSDVLTQEWLAWFGSWSWAWTGAVITILLPLLFPDGRLLSRRWRWVLWTLAVALFLLFVGNAFGPESTAPIRNPLGLAKWKEPLDLIALIGFVLFAGCIGAGVVAVVKRFRRSTGIVRRQMQVFALSAITIAIGTGTTFTAYELGFETVANLVLASVSLLVPLAIGMAVLRYRLYDFGRIVKRTATYTAVGLILLAVYGIAVVGLQAVLGADDSLSVAASTLAAVALFNPVRNRIQSVVDRRFDRARYDATIVVDEFSTRMTQEVDLDQLNSDLTGVVDRTLRPSGLSLWLRAS